VKAEDKARMVVEALAREVGVKPFHWDLLRSKLAAVGFWRSDRARDFTFYLEAAGWIQPVRPEVWRIKRLETSDKALAERLKKELKAWNEAASTEELAKVDGIITALMREEKHGRRRKR